MRREWTKTLWLVCKWENWCKKVLITHRSHMDLCLSQDQKLVPVAADPLPTISFLGRNMGLRMEEPGTAWEWKTEALQSCLTSFKRERGVGSSFHENEKVCCGCAVLGARVNMCLFWELYSAKKEEAKSPRRQSPFFHPHHSSQKQQAYPSVLKPRL